jgi:hypothetical protein
MGMGMEGFQSRGYTLTEYWWTLTGPRGASLLCRPEDMCGNLCVYISGSSGGCCNRRWVVFGLVPAKNNDGRAPRLLSKASPEARLRKLYQTMYNLPTSSCSHDPIPHPAMPDSHCHHMLHISNGWEPHLNLISRMMLRSK